MTGRKELENKIIKDDENEKSITLSKTDFVDLVANNDKFAEKFELIFNKIK